LHARKREVTEGVIKTVSVRPVSNSQVLEVELADPTGCVLLRFYGRGSIPGIRPGQRLRVHGTVGRYGAEAAIANPHYELIDGS
jgi:RecG-like helicase